MKTTRILNTIKNTGLKNKLLKSQKKIQQSSKEKVK